MIDFKTKEMVKCLKKPEKNYEKEFLRHVRNYIDLYLIEKVFIGIMKVRKII